MALQEDASAVMKSTMAAQGKTNVRSMAAAKGKAAIAAGFKQGKKLAQKAVKAAGLPGSGHGVVHGSHHTVDRMTGADDIMSRHTAHTYGEISEITLLFNCFTLAYWLMHLMPVVIPTYFGSLTSTVFAHIMVLTPAMLLMQEVCPITTKYFCMLETMLEKDQDMIGEVYNHMNRVNAQKHAIKNKLQDVGKSMAQDVGLTTEDVNIKILAEMMFKEVDLDGSGSLSYTELRQGMSAFGIYLSKQEFKSVMETIDPDMDGSITVVEWVEFLTCTDEQLESDEWRSYKAIMNVRQRLASELVKRAVNTRSILENVEIDSTKDGLIDVDGLLKVIFDSMDTDGDGALSDLEFRQGLFEFGIEMAESGARVLACLLARPRSLPRGLVVSVVSHTRMKLSFH
jgi:hypothetical protein